MTSSLILPDLSYRVMGCAFEVYKELGPFHSESIYQRALEIALHHKGLSYERQKRIPVSFRTVHIGTAVLDLVVEGLIVLELKAVEGLHPVFITQITSYLAAAELELGIVLNFGSLGKLEYKRVAFTQGYREKRELHANSRL